MLLLLLLLGSIDMFVLYLQLTVFDILLTTFTGIFGAILCLCLFLYFMCISVCMCM